MNLKNTIVECMSEPLRSIFKNIDDALFADFQEIRIRAENPLIIKCKGKEFYLDKNGNMCHELKYNYNAGTRDILNIVERISGYSIYAFEEEIKNGFITIEGGHRIGITGKVVSENGKIKTIKNITGLNIRISHEIMGCSEGVMKYILNKNEVFHTMIISPPGCGKTTLLRDMVRNLSSGWKGFMGKNIGVVDERSEIAGCFMGIPQNDVGIRTDVLDCCPKAEGMIMMIRSMAPEVIAVDEIGKNEDIHSIEYIINAGVKIICTVHGQDMEDVLKKPVLRELIQKNIFQRFIVLENKEKVGNIAGIYNEHFKDIYGKEETYVF